MPVVLLSKDADPIAMLVDTLPPPKDIKVPLIDPDTPNEPVTRKPEPDINSDPVIIALPENGNPVPEPPPAPNPEAAADADTKVGDI
jgi:hypothetical protein